MYTQRTNKTKTINIQASRLAKFLMKSYKRSTPITNVNVFWPTSSTTTNFESHVARKSYLSGETFNRRTFNRFFKFRQFLGQLTIKL